MSSLRNLLGTDHKTDLGIYGQVPSPLADGKQIIFTYDKDCCCYNCGWACQARHTWCVPCGTCRITFEAWGAAGGSAASCCCTTSSIPTTGAYVRKTICGSLGGNCYCICVGRVEGYPDGDGTKRGCRGCWTGITGPSVCICAEGGYGGCAICNMVAAAGASFDYFGQSRIQLFDNATQTDNCVEFGPPGYGGDINLCGRTGFFRYHCACNRAVTQHIPVPPYMHNGANTWVTYKHCTNETCSYAHQKNSAASFVGGGTYDDAWNERERGWASQPFPYPGSTTCGSCCVYASPASSGMVRITYQGHRCGCYCSALSLCTGMADCMEAKHMCN